MIKNNWYNKYLILGIFVLFIGAAIAPSISGYDKKTSIQLLMEAPTSFTPDDYINAFWKFDEGNGNVAGDSSGHGYDGMIYGATWITGKVGQALDFDGTNDYIKLDTYARNKLGFNKTDDLIFSFYFKSSSNNKGVIYSMCRGDGYGYNPGFHIALNSNGTIQTQVWRLSCGIIFSSNNSYNDGEWHYAKIYYNGISANPIVDVFVDGELDTTYKHYVCEFFSDNFRYAQIGRNSYELTNYFDGALDEFKIIKYPGGNEQEPPEIDGPLYIDPNKEYEYTFTTYDPEDDDVWIKVNWGDGSETEFLGQFESEEVVTLSHSWTKDGVYCVKAKSKDRWDESRWSACYYVYIGNQPPSQPTIEGKQYGNPYQELTYTFTSIDIEDQDIYYVIDWGDGTTTETDYYPSNTSVDIPHSWDSNGDYFITAYAVDTYGKEGLESEPYPIRIGDQPPRKPDIDGPISGKSKVEIDFQFTADDPENDKVWFEINWGDGNIEKNVGPSNSGVPLTKSHVWNTSGRYTIKARAKDLYGYESVWGSFDIKIPRNKAIDYNLFEFLFERFPNSFPILKYLFNL